MSQSPRTPGNTLERTGRPPRGNPLQTIPDLFLRRKSRYTVPAAPTMAWSADHSPRRKRVGYLALFGILLFQAALSLRLTNTAYQDEALYLFAGDVYLDHWFSGGPEAPASYSQFFSGAPYLYPVLGAAIDHYFGLAGTRFFSTLCMSGVTTLLYSLTCRLFNVRAALFAAAAYAVVESTGYMGNFATYDAPALFLVAIAFWTVGRFDRSADWPVLLIVPAVLSLAFATKYAAAMFAGPVIAFSVVFAWPYRGPVKAILRGVLLTVTIGIGVAAWVAFGGFLDGLKFTTISREINTDVASSQVLKVSAEYGGIFLLIGIFGAVMYMRSVGLNEVPGGPLDHQPGRVWRFFLAGGMVASGALVPGYQAYIHTSVALHKHIGYSLLFVAPMVGVGLARATGPHFRSPQFAIVLWLILLVPGMSQSDKLFDNGWPNSGKLIELLNKEISPKGWYLSSTPAVQQYYLGAEKAPTDHWTSTYDLLDPYVQKSSLASIKKGKYDMIMIDDQVEPAINAKILETIEATPVYRLRSRFYYGTNQLFGNYMVWSKIK